VLTYSNPYEHRLPVPILLRDRCRHGNALLLVVTYSRAARTTLRNVCRSHESTVGRRLGRAALLAETKLGAFLALRLRAKHGDDVQVERTRPFNEFEAVPESVREAAEAYEDRETPSTPYAKFAAGTDHPDPEAMRDADL
jgi:hypothetical protein